MERIKQDVEKGQLIGFLEIIKHSDQNYFAATYKSSTIDNSNNFLVFLIEVGFELVNKKLKKFAFVSLKNDFIVEELKPFPMVESGIAYTEAGYICQLMSESYPQLPKSFEKFLVKPVNRRRR